jgi:hypothetical protein
VSLLVAKKAYKVRMYYEVLGGHTHVRVFAGSATSHGLGKCGDLIFRNEEWEAYMATKNPIVEFLPEGLSATNPINKEK